MGRVTSMFARKVAAQADDGRHAAELLGALGLEREGAADPGFMVPAEDYYAFFEQAAAADPDPTTLPLRVGDAWSGAGATPNRLEYDQGFFVKQGDGAADVKPIAHLYKTQVYALAEHLSIPDEIRTAPPTTDTYSMVQGQDEFYFALPYSQMDVALWCHGEGCTTEEMAVRVGLGKKEAEFVYADIESKRRTTAYQHAPALTIEPVFR